MYGTVNHGVTSPAEVEPVAAAYLSAGTRQPPDEHLVGSPPVTVRALVGHRLVNRTYRLIAHVFDDSYMMNVGGAVTRREESPCSPAVLRQLMTRAACADRTFVCARRRSGRLLGVVALSA